MYDCSVAYLLDHQSAPRSRLTGSLALSAALGHGGEVVVVASAAAVEERLALSQVLVVVEARDAGATLA